MRVLSGMAPRAGTGRTGGREAGFTLTEVLTVIALMGIVFGIASSTWFNLVDNRRVDAAANQLKADLRLAHSTAQSRLADWRILFRPDGSQINCGAVQASYCMVRLKDPYPAVSPPTAERVEPRYLPERTRIVGSNLPDDSTPQIVGLSITGDRRAIEFNADGSAVGLSTSLTEPRVSVGLQDGSLKRDLFVLTTTSRVRVAF